MKNKIMRIASVLMVLTLLSTCAISGTFAKYTTTDSASDSARVAKWGVLLTVNGSLYEDDYIDAPQIDGTANLTVEGAAQVVAPGTTGNTLKFALTGDTEVAVLLNATIVAKNVFLADNTYARMTELGTMTHSQYLGYTGSELYTKSDSTYTPATGWVDGTTYYLIQDVAVVAADYFPVIYTSGMATTGSYATDSLQTIAATIAKALNGGTDVTPTTSGYENTYTVTDKFYAANTQLATAAGIDNETLTWGWAFENNTEYNAADTILGLLQAGDGNVVKLSGTDYIAVESATDYNLETSFSMTITVTQKD